MAAASKGKAFLLQHCYKLLEHKVGKGDRRKRGGWHSPSAYAVLKRPRRGLGGHNFGTIKLVYGLL
jgi:hypothetical protein